MISERISDDVSPQMKILNKVIPIPMHFCSFISILSVTCHHQTKRDVINDVKLFPTVYRRIFTLSNKASRYKSKCIRMAALMRPTSEEENKDAVIKLNYWPNIHLD